MRDADVAAVTHEAVDALADIARSREIGVEAYVPEEAVPFMRAV